MKRYLTVGLLAALLSMEGCGSDQPGPTTVPLFPHADVLGSRNQLIVRWLFAGGATSYQVLENLDGHSGFTQLGEDVLPPILGLSKDISVHRFDFVNAQYLVRACNPIGCTDSRVLSPQAAMRDTVHYFKATNTESQDQFGNGLALSADGSIMAISSLEDSRSPGINGAADDNSMEESGAVYVYRNDGVSWDNVDYLKASNPGAGDRFGFSIALSADGSTLAVGSLDDSDSTGDGSANDNDLAADSGAVFIFRFDGATWMQEAYIKASNAEAGDLFGSSVSLSADGNTLIVGAPGEDSGRNGAGNPQFDNSADDSGAAYLFAFTGQTWSQVAVIKSSNTDSGDGFGTAVAMSDGGTRILIGAPAERSVSTGIDGDQTDNSLPQAGAAYLFAYDGADLIQEAYLKPGRQLRGGSAFGGVLDVSGDGTVVAIGAVAEESAATGINADPGVGVSEDSGAVYVFRTNGTEWTQEAYIKASNTGAGDAFGSAIALGFDGSELLIAAPGEDSQGIGVQGNDADDALGESGGAYYLRFDGIGWRQQTYLKASNTDSNDRFGTAVAISADGHRAVVGAPGESGSSRQHSGNQDDDSAPAAGAVYMY